MAISGSFLADFANFYDACQKAETSLKSIESGGSKVQASLDKMVDSFSGRKIIQEANLMAQTFDRLQKEGIGLTSQELARMGAAGAAASEKLLAMGQKVPEGIQRITNASKEAAEKLTAMGQDFGIQKVATEFKALGDHTATATTSFGSLVASFVT